MAAQGRAVRALVLLPPSATGLFAAPHRWTERAPWCPPPCASGPRRATSRRQPSRLVTCAPQGQGESERGRMSAQTRWFAAARPVGARGRRGRRSCAACALDARPCEPALRRCAIHHAPRRAGVLAKPSCCQPCAPALSRRCSAARCETRAAARHGHGAAARGAGAGRRGVRGAHRLRRANSKTPAELRAQHDRGGSRDARRRSEVLVSAGPGRAAQREWRPRRAACGLPARKRSPTCCHLSALARRAHAHPLPILPRARCERHQEAARAGRGRRCDAQRARSSATRVRCRASRRLLVRLRRPAARCAGGGVPLARRAVGCCGPGDAAAASARPE